MWPFNLSVRLPIVDLVSRYLTNYLIGREPIFQRIAPLITVSCGTVILCGISICFQMLSPSERQVAHALLTRPPLSYLGDPFADSYEELKSVFEGQEYVQDYIDETEDGDLITVYKPITNSAGKVVAVLGCDYDASDITARLEASLVGVVKIGAVCIVLAVAALSIIISTITRGLQKVDDKIYEIVHNEGDLTQKLDIHSGDEMELIAGNVNALLEYIRGIMLKISDNSEHLNGSSQKIAQNLAAAEVNITDVSATMEEMSAAMEETNASLEQISTSVGQVYASIENMAARAEHGKESSGEMNGRADSVRTEASSKQQERALRRDPRENQSRP